jgi:uncharacterized protein
MQDPMHQGDPFRADAPIPEPHGAPPNSVSHGTNPGMPPQTECVMAGLSHLSILLPQFGLFVPLILWLVNRENAPYAAYQSQQAFWFQLVVNIGFWIVAALGTVLGFATFGLGFLALLPILGLWHVLASIYGIVGGVFAFQGRDFRYFLLGDMIKPK